MQTKVSISISHEILNKSLETSRKGSCYKSKERRKFMGWFRCTHDVFVGKYKSLK